MSLTLKIGSLVIRTLAKPLANRIKQSAREHERVRKVFVNFSQSIHRIDMRLRLGLLQDTATIDRQIAKEVKEAEARLARQKIKDETPTVKTLEETKAEEAAHKKLEKDIARKVEEKEKSKPKPRIRPLSEAKAIETGANFVSEAFLFFVGAGIIIFEQFRSRRKASGQRAELDDRLDKLEAERDELKATLSELQKEIQERLAKDAREKAELNTVKATSITPEGSEASTDVRTASNSKTDQAAQDQTRRAPSDQKQASPEKADGKETKKS